MRVALNPVDSELLGGAVLEICDIGDAVEPEKAEESWVAEWRPVLAVVRIPALAVGLAQTWEDLGFRFAECQLELRRRVTSLFPVPSDAYEHFRVEDERDLEGVLELAGRIFAHDRFSLDPRFGPAVSGMRYRAYVKRSFQRPDEEVLALRDRSTRGILGFGTVRRTSATEARALLGGVAAEHQRTGLALINDHFGSNYSFDRGIRAVTTAVSAAHGAVLNVHLGHMGYRVTGTWTVLRKTYV